MATVARGPSLADVCARAEALVPRLRERARSTEQLRRLPDETVQEFHAAGLFRVFQPARFGGFELDYGRTQVELSLILGQACGSSAWVQSVVACHAWVLGMFPGEAQDAVWGADPNTLIATSFAPATGRGRPVDGGYFVEGEWQFSSGSNISQWLILGTPIVESEGAPAPRMLFTLLPRSAWQVLDTWYAAGLKGSASNDVRVPGVFVPHAFTLDTSRCDGRPTPGSAVNPSHLFRLPLWPIFPYNVSTPALGIARGALQAYIESVAARPERAAMPQRQLRIAESGAEIDAAVALLLHNARVLAHSIETGAMPDAAFLARSTRDTSFAVKLCVQAVERLAVAVGAHGMLDDTPIQRALRDVHALANHNANGFDTAGLAYARHELGLPPITRG